MATTVLGIGREQRRGAPFEKSGENGGDKTDEAKVELEERAEREAEHCRNEREHDAGPMPLAEHIASNNQCD